MGLHLQLLQYAWRVCSHSMAMEKLLDNMVTIQSTEVLHAGTTADG